MKKALVHIVYLILIAFFTALYLINKAEAQKQQLAAEENAMRAQEAAEEAMRAAAEARRTQDEYEMIYDQLQECLNK